MGFGTDVGGAFDNGDMVDNEENDETRAEGIRLAERSVVFDLALRMSKSENVIWSLLHDTETMIARLPKV